MAHWVRFRRRAEEAYGLLSAGRIQVCAGDPFSGAEPTDVRYPIDDVEIMPPCRPQKLIGLWNNFFQRAEIEHLQVPPEPLYFIKPANSYLPHGGWIRRPPHYTGQIVFEGELGIVIGRECHNVGEAGADACILGYTCVNDVTARDLLKRDPTFVQWTRAKGFDTFGAFGPSIATDIEPENLTVRTLVNGEERQVYPVSDMIFSPRKLVSLISRDVRLEPGDVIACGTSVGTAALEPGDEVIVSIDQVGALRNTLH